MFVIVVIIGYKFSNDFLDFVTLCVCISSLLFFTV